MCLSGLVIIKINTGLCCCVCLFCRTKSLAYFGSQISSSKFKVFPRVAANILIVNTETTSQILFKKTTEIKINIVLTHLKAKPFKMNSEIF